MEHHLVIGAGPVGSGVARRLAEQGIQVTLVTRSGAGPEHALISRVGFDANRQDELAAAARGVSVVYNCANPPYHRWATDWPPLHRSVMAAAQRSGAVLVLMDNLYAFGPGTPMPMTHDAPLRATGTKGRTRKAMAEELLAAHASGRIRATLARASDFFGPEVTNSSMGERVLPRVLAGKKVSVLGRTDLPHSASFMPDVVTTLTTIGADERAWGRAWHVPSITLTQAELVAAFAAAAGTEVKVGTVPRTALRVLGLFAPMMRELQETWYQFAEPWVVDAQSTEQTFGLHATPLDVAAKATVEWWRARA